MVCHRTTCAPTPMLPPSFKSSFPVHPHFLYCPFYSIFPYLPFFFNLFFHPPLTLQSSVFFLLLHLSPTYCFYTLFVFTLFCPASCLAALNTSLFYFSSPPKVGQQSDLLFAFTSIFLPSSACIPILPYVPPFLALSLFACLPFTNHCSRQTSSHQSNPTTKGTPVTAGHFDWHWPETHTHTKLSPGQKPNLSHSFHPLLSRHIVTFP